MDIETVSQGFATASQSCTAPAVVDLTQRTQLADAAMYRLAMWIHEGVLEHESQETGEGSEIAG